MVDLTVVIVNTNTRQLLEECLNSVVENTAGIKYEIIVVDNDSNDGSPDMVRNEFPTVKLLLNDRNLGFSVSNNRGFTVSSGRYVLALNPDTLVCGNALSQMVEFMDEHPEAGACGCKLLNADRSLQPSWESFPTVLSEIFYSTPLNRLFSHNKRLESHGVYEVDWVSGACMMVRRETLEEVGMFDERFSPIYSEETDWCYRIKTSGWKIYYLPDPSIVHLEGQTTKEKPTWFFLQLQRNKYVFFRKHKGLLYAELYRLLRTASSLAVLFLSFGGYVVRPGSRDFHTRRAQRNWELMKLFCDRRLRMPDRI